VDDEKERRRTRQMTEVLVSRVLFCNRNKPHGSEECKQDGRELRQKPPEGDEDEEIDFLMVF
jgi:hypothetical protein